MSIDGGIDKQDMVRIYNRILLSYKKEWNDALYSNMDGPKNCHTEWRERQISYDTAYMWNLTPKKWYKGTCLQNSNWVLDVENKLTGNSLWVQWLRIYASNVRGAASIPGLSTKIPYASRHSPLSQKKKSNHLLLPWGKEEVVGINWEIGIDIYTPKVKVLVIQSYLTLCDPMDCSPPGSFFHGIIQARIVEWVAIPFSRGSSQPRDWIQVSHIASRFFTSWATREVQEIGRASCRERVLRWV